MSFSLASLYGLNNNGINLSTSLRVRQFTCVLVFLVYALIPLFGELGFVQVAIILVSLVFGTWLKRPGIKTVPRNTTEAQGKVLSVGALRVMSMFGLLTLSIIAFWQGGGAWLSGETFVTFFSVFLALKWLESQRVKELYLIIYGALVLMAVSSRYLSGASVLVFVLLGALLFILTLHGLESRKPLSLKACWFVLKLFLFALPLVVMLFITFPRIQGPLWDLGIVMGLPISLVVDQSQQDKVIKSTLKAGQVSRLKQDDAPVLVAEFENATPFKSRLYWRGPVFNQYDGIEWHLDKGWNNRNHLLRKAFKGKDLLENNLKTKSELVSYEARVSANNSRYLYALDLPAGQSTESFISDEFQLLGIRKLSSEFNYEQKAWLEYSGGRALTDAQRDKYMQLPRNSNPRLLAWGRELAAKHLSVADQIQALRVHLAQGDYKLTEKPSIEESPNSLDVFFFESKKGGIEHLASSAAIVLRAAGIPSRLVSGYRGGSIIALTNFIVVRQANAHVWVEAWRDDAGWFRVEAKDFVVPPLKEKQLSHVKTEKQLIEAAKKSQTSNQKIKSKAELKQPAAQANKTTEKDAKKQKQSKEIQWLNTLGAGIETWIFNYNPERQIELIQKSGVGKVDWKGLLSVAALGVVALFAIYGLFVNIRRDEQDPVAKSFEQLNRHLAKHDLQCSSQECLSQWLLRMKTLAPQFYPAFEAVATQYINLRYRTIKVDPKKGTAQLKEFKRDIKRLSAML